MMEIEPPSEEESGEFIRDVLAHMFHEIMSTSEMHDKFEELPTEPPIPYFRDIKEYLTSDWSKGVCKIIPWLNLTNRVILMRDWLLLN